MSILFDDANSEYIYTSSAPAGLDYGWTIVAWIKPDVLQSKTAVGLSDASSTEDFLRLGVSGTTNNPVYASSNGGAERIAYSTTYPSVDTWHHIACKFTSNVFRYVQIDGGSEGLNDSLDNTINFSNIDTMSIGALLTSGGSSSYFSGYVAEVAIYNDILIDAEIDDLAGGEAPSDVSADSLVHYWPLKTDTNDTIGSLHLSSSNGSPSIDSDHPIGLTTYEQTSQIDITITVDSEQPLIVGLPATHIQTGDINMAMIVDGSQGGLEIPSVTAHKLINLIHTGPRRYW